MRRAGWLLLLCALAESQASACSVPVFRYALENWKPSPYEVHVFHRGPLSSAERDLIKKLEAPANPANLSITVVDVSGMLTPEVERLWSRSRIKGLPSLLVRYPDDDEKSPPAWSAPLSDSSVRQLLDSPTRKQLVSLLTRGESVVYLLLLGGDRVADAAAERLLKTELLRLQSALKLPEQKEEDSELRSTLPLRLSLPYLKLDRNKSEEQFFVRLLLGSEEGLEKVDGPIVFPIFGRGRVLAALHGEQLTAAHLERWTTFLCGACSCWVKEDNPGIDLLVCADWDELLETAQEKPPAPTITTPAIPPGRAEPEDQQSDQKPPCRCWLWTGVAGGAVFLAAIGLLVRRSRAAR